jgi:addiction module HigA family antidote
MARSAIHPGEHLADAMEGLGVTAARLARDIQVPANGVTGIVHGTRAITADTASRLGRYLGTSAEFWMNLQQMYELRRAAERILLHAP